MFPKYSRKKEIRGQSCQGFVSAFREKGQHFYFPSPATGISAQNGTGRLTTFLLTVLRDSLGSGEVCAYHLEQVWKPPEMTP